MYCDYERPAFYTHSEPVARKRHQCVECSAPIEVGEKHFAYTGKWDGRIGSGRQHLLCMEACMLIRDRNEGECIPFGGLFEWWSECCWAYPPAHRPDKLRSMLAKIKWRSRRFRKRRVSAEVR